jgi:hypothetical protein
MFIFKNRKLKDFLVLALIFSYAGAAFAGMDALTGNQLKAQARILSREANEADKRVLANHEKLKVLQASQRNTSRAANEAGKVDDTRSEHSFNQNFKKNRIKIDKINSQQISAKEAAKNKHLEASHARQQAGFQFYREGKISDSKEQTEKEKVHKVKAQLLTQ